MKPRSALVICREALRRGPLIRCGQSWRFGRRGFGFHTVEMLIALGEAVRDGDTVRGIHA